MCADVFGEREGSIIKPYCVLIICLFVCFVCAGTHNRVEGTCHRIEVKVRR